MAVLEFNAPAPTANQGARRTPFTGLNTPDRPKASVWLNIGYEVNGKFINLPFGLPLDTMNDADIRGQNTDFVKQRTAQNELLAALKKAGMNLQPGQEVTLNLELRMRRVNEELHIAAAENEYAVDLSSLIMPVVAAAE